MSYCINPECKERQNLDTEEFCQACGTPLEIEGRYRLLKPLRALNYRLSNEIFEVDDFGTRKVMKILRGDRPEEVERFEREALTLQLLNHPGIPKVDIDGYFVFFPERGSEILHCFVMEKIEGLNLEQWLNKYGTISQKLALNWLKQLIQILDVLHREKFFHRDIKPSNIICQPDGKLALIDFGSVREMSATYMAKMKQFSNLNQQFSNFKTEVSKITAILSGGYTPQEQMDGKALPQSDFFALGRTFVHLLTGKHPSELPSHPRTGQLVWRKFAPQISYPLADFIDTLMARQPHERPQNTQWIIKNLNRKRLLLQSIDRFLNLPLFKLSVASLLTLAFIYRLSFPWRANFYYDRGVEAIKEGQFNLAREYTEQALKFASKNKKSKIYNNLGFICQQQNAIDCAIDAYETALDIDKENPVTQYNLGGVYDDAGNFDRAAANYEQAMKSNRPVSINATSDLARLNILQGDTETAIELSLQGLEKAQKLEEAQKYQNKERVRSALHKNLGWAYWEQGENLEAQENLRDAISLNKDRTDAYCLMALVLEAQDRQMEALDFWDSCIHVGNKTGIEVRTWQTMARQRLQQSKPDKSL